MKPFAGGNVENLLDGNTLGLDNSFFEKRCVEFEVQGSEDGRILHLTLDTVYYIEAIGLYNRNDESSGNDGLQMDK